MCDQTTNDALDVDEASILVKVTLSLVFPNYISLFISKTLIFIACIKLFEQANIEALGC